MSNVPSNTKIIPTETNVHLNRYFGVTPLQQIVLDVTNNPSLFYLNIYNKGELNIVNTNNSNYIQLRYGDIHSFGVLKTSNIMFRSATLNIQLLDTEYTDIFQNTAFYQSNITFDTKQLQFTTNQCAFLQSNITNNGFLIFFNNTRNESSGDCLNDTIITNNGRLFFSHSSFYNLRIILNNTNLLMADC
jgi:hypothetical protein